MREQHSALLERLQTQFPGRLEVVLSIDQPTVIVPREMLLTFAEHVKNEEGYAMFLDIAAADWFPLRPRFELIYHVYHPEKFQRMRFKSFVGEQEEMPSLVSLWAGANWPEREAYDLFGIVFHDHPNLTRIYLPDDWDGYPLRKDYPTVGNRVD